MNIHRFFRAALLMLSLGTLAQPAVAERADRDKPVNIEADRITVDDRNKIQTLEGKVVLTQGTTTLRADKIVVTQDIEGFQKGVAYAGPNGLAHFRTKREGKDEYVDGEGERIEHDSRSEKTQFFNRAYVKSGQDEVRGQYIQYDGVTENYLVTSGPNATSAAATGGRVRAVIQPKNKDAGQKPADTSDAGKLKAAPDIPNSRQE